MKVHVGTIVGNCVTNHIGTKIYHFSGRKFVCRRRYGYALLGANGMKRKHKEEYCIQRKTFDRLNRKYKRQFQAQERQKIEDKLSAINQHDFWKSIEKLT